jgi:hypothetical protein
MSCVLVERKEKASGIGFLVIVIEHLYSAAHRFSSAPDPS